MQNNERTNRNKEKKRIKDKKVKTVIWIVLGVVLAILLVMKVCEIDFNYIKNHISSIGNVAMTNEEIYPYSLDTSGESDVQIVNNKLAVLTDSSLSVVDPSNAKTINSFEHGYTNPYLLSASDYTLLFDRGGTRLRLDTSSRNIYEKNVERNIITAAVAKNGSVAYSTFSDDADCILVIMSKNEKSKLELPIKDGYITSIALNSSASKCTYVTVNTQDAVLVSTVHILNVSSGDDVSSMSFNGSNILNVNYSNQGNVYIVGDDFLSVVSNQKEVTQVFEKGSIKTNLYCYNSDNELVLNYKDYSNSTDSKLAFVRPNGKIKTSVELDVAPKYISASSNEVTVLYTDCFKIYSLTKGEVKRQTEVDNSVNSVHTLGSKNYVQYGQYVDVK